MSRCVFALSRRSFFCISIVSHVFYKRIFHALPIVLLKIFWGFHCPDRVLGKMKYIDLNNLTKRLSVLLNYKTTTGKNKAFPSVFYTRFLSGDLRTRSHFRLKLR